MSTTTIRNGWRATRLKFAVSVNHGVLPDSTSPEWKFRYIDIANVSQGSLSCPPESVSFRKAPSRARRLADPGDTVISTVRTYLRASALVPEHDDPLVFSTGLAVLKPGPSLDKRWLSYYTQSDPFISWVEAHSTGVSYPAISPARLACAPLEIPPLAHQREIADYLDCETARIDELVAKQERLITGLDTRTASALASLASTRVGAPAPLKRALRKLSRPSLDGGGVVTAFRDGEVTLRTNRRLDGFTESLNQAGFQGVLEGDLVFHALDGFAGAVGVSDSKGNASPVYHVCEALDGHDPRYVALALRNAALTGFLSTQAPNVRQRSVDFRNWATFARVQISFAQPNQQHALVEQFERDRAETEHLISKAQRFIELAKERRAALITAAVTGQLDILGTS